MNGVYLEEETWCDSINFIVFSVDGGQWPDPLQTQKGNHVVLQFPNGIRLFLYGVKVEGSFETYTWSQKAQLIINTATKWLDSTYKVEIEARRHSRGTRGCRGESSYRIYQCFVL